jgi:hypothetical protein
LVGRIERPAQIKVLPFTIGESSRVTLIKYWFGTFGPLSAGDPGNNIPPEFPQIIADGENQPINVTHLLKYAFWRTDISPGLSPEELDIKLLVNTNQIGSPDDER